MHFVAVVAAETRAPDEPCRAVPDENDNMVKSDLNPEPRIADRSRTVQVIVKQANVPDPKGDGEIVPVTLVQGSGASVPTDADNVARGDTLAESAPAAAGTAPILPAHSPAGSSRTVPHAAAVTTEPKDLPAAVVSRAQVMIRRGESSAIINLDPPSLGKLRLEIAADGAAVAARVTVQSAEVRDLIQATLPQLRESFAQNGLTVQSFEVHVDARDGGQGGHLFRPHQDAFPGWTGNQPEAGRADGSIPSAVSKRSGSPLSRYVDYWM
jgi:flagellar hook-length control protein FliK